MAQISLLFVLEVSNGYNKRNVYFAIGILALDPVYLVSFLGSQK